MPAQQKDQYAIAQTLEAETIRLTEWAHSVSLHDLAFVLELATLQAQVHLRERASRTMN
jgi:hypothetical protein